MTMRRIFAFLAPALVVGALVPLFASAQYNYNCSNYPWWYTQSQSCTPGTLFVYVQVLNNTQNTPIVRQSSDFIVSVSGGNPSPASFPGSVNGTPVTVMGQYSVSAAQPSGYSAGYSVGCSGDVRNNQQATCVITESATAPYYTQPQPYPYPIVPITLQCAPAYQTVALGQTATFDAIGSAAGGYNWSTADRTYLNVGPRLATTLQSTGLQTVMVSNGSQSASCTVNVVANANAAYTAPATPTVASVTVLPVTSAAPNPVVTSSYSPSLPNTGFEPHTAFQWTLAMVALIALSTLALPYVRKAFATVVR